MKKASPLMSLEMVLVFCLKRLDNFDELLFPIAGNYAVRLQGHGYVVLTSTAEFSCKNLDKSTLFGFKYRSKNSKVSTNSRQYSVGG